MFTSLPPRADSLQERQLGPSYEAVQRRRALLLHCSLFLFFHLPSSIFHLNTRRLERLTVRERRAVVPPSIGRV
ncbi:hypothetical protein M431DRAFT_397029 [Trichoderma harzianum CBS 226.95]|uniref:Uncharacterized protein n=1 Tax=Trichoderma harzianum CBS 226.95 TaxID=983964 RepID=A0A2T3ZRM0_TRIHA|nr:hypothetical protein M431DRAFT_397029 [Trichoderma harzianum CBS 226.95]PTB47450.1 hypothetical protein M431DRAFT_397029 [Trichoderma harzianum CBS 226.95]